MLGHCLGHPEVQRVFVWTTVRHTDRPSTTLVHQAIKDSKRTRWALSLQPYQYRLEVKKGSQNVGADCMSRKWLRSFYMGCLKSSVLAHVYDLGRNKL